MKFTASPATGTGTWSYNADALEAGVATVLALNRPTVAEAMDALVAEHGQGVLLKGGYVSFRKKVKDKMGVGDDERLSGGEREQISQRLIAAAQALPAEDPRHIAAIPPPPAHTGPRV